MNSYDFFVTGINSNTLTVEKLPFISDIYGIKKVDGKAWPLLNKYLSTAGVTDDDIGLIIEKLEGLPYGSAQEFATGRDDKIIVINQIR